VEEQALYVRDGDAYVGTILTQGGWDPKGANGGAVLALLGQCLDEVPSLVPMGVSRFTADLVRPVPLGRRLHVVPTVLREGKKIQLVQLLLLVDGVEHVRATVLRLRQADVTGGGAPPSSTAERPADALLPPEESISLRGDRVEMPGFLRAIDMRRAATRDGSGTGLWVRLDVPVVAGEPTSASVALTLGIDYVNLIGLAPDTTLLTMTMINPDVTAQVLRPPTGEWIAVTGDTRLNPALGRGISYAQLSDADGVFATASASQLIQPR
jgi:hypothetical protein